MSSSIILWNLASLARGRAWIETFLERPGDIILAGERGLKRVSDVLVAGRLDVARSRASMEQAKAMVGKDSAKAAIGDSLEVIREARAVGMSVKRT